jgi:hypothetical protein
MGKTYIEGARGRLSGGSFGFNFSDLLFASACDIAPIRQTILLLLPPFHLLCLYCFFQLPSLLPLCLVTIQQPERDITALDLIPTNQTLERSTLAKRQR